MANKNFGENEQVFVFTKGAYVNANPSAIMTAEGEIKQAVLVHYLRLAELQKEQKLIREWIVGAIKSGAKIEQGELRANINEYDKGVFNKELALELLATVGIKEEDLTTKTTANRLDIR